MSDAARDLGRVVEYWEPWTPKVGDRVRVHLSGECLGYHASEQDGVLGTVDDIIDFADIEADNATAPTPEDVITREDIAGHIYSIVYDAPISIRLSKWEVALGFSPYEEDDLFAAAELEPIKDESDG
jgi:hypothetical protein